MGEEVEELRERQSRELMALNRLSLSVSSKPEMTQEEEIKELKRKQEMEIEQQKKLIAAHCKKKLGAQKEHEVKEAEEDDYNGSRSNKKREEQLKGEQSEQSEQSKMETEERQSGKQQLGENKMAPEGKFM